MSRLITNITLNKQLFNRLRYPLIKSLSTKPVVKENLKDDSEESSLEKLRARAAQMKQRTKIKKPQKPPFAKNLFLGEYDTDILTYPQFSKDELEELDKSIEPVKNFFSLPENLNVTQLTGDFMNKLSDLQLFGLRSPQVIGGRELDVTETCRFSEIISEHKLGTMLLNNEQFGIQTLLKQGTDIQKQNYLNDLVAGKITSAFCYNEADTADSRCFNTRAKYDKNKNIWIINGKKSYVVNGSNADVFIVLAATQEHKNYNFIEGNLTAFLVDKNFGGIRTEKCNISDNNLDNISNVTFENTPVPPEYIIGQVNCGEKVFMSIITEARLSVGSVTSTLMKKLINKFGSFCIYTNTGSVPLAVTDVARSKITEIAMNLYAIESMTYLTSKLLDDYENQDCEIETAIVKIFATEKFYDATALCMNLIGAPCIEKNHFCNELHQDAIKLLLLSENNDNLKLIVSLLGLQHSGKQLQETVKKLRNPVFHAPLIIKRMFTQRRQAADNPKLSLDLSQYLHPSLVMSSQMLEYCLFRVQFATETMLVRHGNEVINQHFDLKRLSNCIIDIYAMTACLGRASRSYCIGLQHADYELYIASSFCLDAMQRIKKTVLEIYHGPYQTNDENYRKIAKRFIKFKEYFPVHPLSRNF